MKFKSGKFKVFFALLMLIIVTPSYAKKYLIGRDLLVNCSAAVKISKQYTGKEPLEILSGATWCAGFVSGLYAIDPKECPPSEEFENLFSVIVRYLETHQEILNIPLNDATRIILKNTYPEQCLISLQTDSVDEMLKIYRLQSGLNASNQLIDMLIDNNGHVNRLLLWEAQPFDLDMPIPWTNGYKVVALMENIEGSIDKEWNRFQKTQRPRVSDNDSVIKLKLIMQHQILDGSLSIIKNGISSTLNNDESLDSENIDLAIKAIKNKGKHN